jgi:GDP-4-dehydro-6-deoxy-D-mannose reductase
VLVTGSSEVYGVPSSSSDLPFTEESSIAPATTYAMSKAAQESIALAYATRADVPVVVARSFSHTGPGQRPVFVVPAMAQRIRAVSEGMAASVPVGNLDVKRDVSDVRDVVVAYRLLIDAALRGSVPPSGVVVNVCSGTAVSIREIFHELCRVGGVQPPIRVDEDLVRKGDAPEIRGDRSMIGTLVGWQPTIPLSVTLADVWAATSVSAHATAV